MIYTSSSSRTPNEKDLKIFPLMEYFSLTFVTKPMVMQSFHSKHISNNLTLLIIKKDLGSHTMFLTPLSEMTPIILFTSICFREDLMWLTI